MIQGRSVTPSAIPFMKTIVRQHYRFLLFILQLKRLKAKNISFLVRPLMATLPSRPLA